MLEHDLAMCGLARAQRPRRPEWRHELRRFDRGGKRHGSIVLALGAEALETEGMVTIRSHGPAILELRLAVAALFTQPSLLSLSP